MVLEVPRHRNVPSRTAVFDNFSRTEQALLSAMMEMVVTGVSTKKVSDIVEEARKVCDEIIRDYKDVAENAMKILDEGFESSMTVMTLPEHYRRFYRTSNHIERLNKELKRRSKVIGVFPNEESLVRIIGSYMIEMNGKLRKKKRIFKGDIYDILGFGVTAKLLDIAHEQLKLIAT